MSTYVSQTWMPDSSCEEEYCPNELFDEGDSTSYNASESTRTITTTYGDVTGIEVSDFVCIGKACTDANFKFTAVQSAIDAPDPADEFATDTDDDDSDDGTIVPAVFMTGFDFDGVCGLGSDSGTDNLVERIQKNGDLSAWIFTTHLNNDVTPFIYFGGEYESVNSYSWALMPDSPDHWGAAINSMSFDLDRANSVVLSSASEYNHMGDADMVRLEAVFKVVHSNCIYVGYELYCPGKCTTEWAIQAFPDIQIEIGDIQKGSIRFTLKPEDYITRKKLVNVGGGVFTYQDNVAADTCYAMFKGLRALNSEDYIILGQPFYKSFEIVHDMEDERIGFMAMNASPSVSATSVIVKKSSDDDDSSNYLVLQTLAMTIMLTTSLF